MGLVKNTSFLNHLRSWWAVVRRGSAFPSALTDQLYRIYLNHNKVIHYRDGYPVRSIGTPALFSAPSANFFARTFYRVIQNRNLPNMMSIAINDECNVNCTHCSFFSGVEEKGRTTLTLKQMKNVIRQAQELGVSMFNFVGGEPLMREDLAEIIASVDKNLATTILFTNGLLLKQEAQKLRKAGLDSVYVSIDSSDPVKHDRFRGHKGLFEEAMTGIREAKKRGFTVGISCCLTPQSFLEGELERMVELAKREGVHEVLFFDAMPTGRYKHRKDLLDNGSLVEEMVERAIPFNLDQSYPGVVVWGYMTSHRSVGCACGTSYMYLSPYGDIMSCDFNHTKFGSVLELPLYQIWDGLTTRQEFCRSKWGGCKIKSSEMRDKDCIDAGKACC